MTIQDGSPTPHDSGSTLADSGPGQDATTPADSGTTPADSGMAMGDAGNPSASELNEVRAASTHFDLPFDSAPSPDGLYIFYTGLRAGAGILARVNIDGTNGYDIANDLLMPLGLAIAPDGNSLFVADIGFDSGSGMPGGDGVIYAVGTSSGAGMNKSPLASTQGYEPRGLDLVATTAPANSLLYFTGRDPGDGALGVFTVNPGGTLNVVAKSTLFQDLSSVVVTSTGTLFVTDYKSSAGQSSTVFIVPNGVAANTAVFVGGLRLGWPAGLALSQDEHWLIVSGLDPETGTAVVYRIEIAHPMNITAYNTGAIGNNEEAGGLHRARSVDRFAWAGKDTVYVIGTTQTPLP
jgi:hypothetical protein